VTANYCRGKKSNYTIWNNQKTNTKFTGKGMDFIQTFKTYIELHDYNEVYEITAPTLSIHNLIIGTPYVDIGGSAVVRLLGESELKCTINFTKRGYFSKEEFKCEGEVFQSGEGKKKSKKKHNQNLFKILGNWNSKIYVTEFNDAGKLDESSKVCVFEKNPYPEKWAYMYGMSHFSLQLNYFPNRLKNVVAPTDTRRRPDQRYLEEGDMINAAAEKDRLETKQRVVRKKREAENIEH